VTSAGPLTDLPDGATGAAYVESSDGMLLRTRLRCERGQAPVRRAARGCNRVRPTVGRCPRARCLVRAGHRRGPPADRALHTVRHVVNPGLWYRWLDQDIAAGPRGPRAGALVDEFRRLRQIVETK
jgi:hypothetical protein